MTPEEFEQLPILGLGDTANNDPTGYTALQQLLLPYIEYYHAFLWICFGSILLFLFIKYLALPICKKSEGKS